MEAKLHSRRCVNLSHPPKTKPTFRVINSPKESNMCCSSNANMSIQQNNAALLTMRIWPDMRGVAPMEDLDISV